MSPRGRVSPRRLETSLSRVEDAMDQHAIYLYDGEEKLCRESPLTRADLLLDTGRLLHLAYLAESLVSPLP